MAHTAPASLSLEEKAAQANAAVAAITDPKLVNSDLIDAATMANAALTESQLAEKRTHKMGDKVLLSGNLADQTNPLTNQVIPHGAPVVAVYDRWIEIQLEAGVLTESAL